MTPALLGVAAAIGYAFGCISFANLIARRQGIVDLREIGDRNPGYWNARKRLGARGSRPVLFLDAAKGAAAVGVGLLLLGVVGDDPQMTVWGGIAGWVGVVVGHMFPITMRFRGGRSLLCFAGGAIVLVPLAAVVGAAVLLVVRWRFGFARGIQACVFVGPFAVWAIYGAGPELLAGVVLLVGIGIRAALADRALRKAGIDKNHADVA